MTANRVYFIECGECDAMPDTPALESLREYRARIRQQGWIHVYGGDLKPGGEDYCPECAEGYRATHPK